MSGLPNVLKIRTWREKMKKRKRGHALLEEDHGCPMKKEL